MNLWRPQILSLPCVLIAAHPDDEVIGLGGQLHRLSGPIVHVTDGAPKNLHDAHAAGFSTREEYAAARRKELLSAVALAGIDADRCVMCQVADQEASFVLEDLSLRIRDLLDRVRPQVVFTHPYEGGHPDHDAVAFAVRAAAKLLAKEQHVRPAVFEFTSYHAGLQGMETDFLPSDEPIHALRLQEPEIALKRRMIDCYTTQKRIISQFPVDLEQIRKSPEYDFLQPPHAGPLFYEAFDWGICGKQWREMAAKAQLSLRI